MTALDTGICIAESLATLRLQQNQLLRGTRDVQMFPSGTSELDLPDGLSRHCGLRGVFHFRPDRISADQIDALSSAGRENEFLNLGAFSKFDIALRVRGGDTLTCITEYTPDGIELRSAAATDGTIESQHDYFNRSKEPDSVIVVGDFPERVRLAMGGR